ncbi:hypothetical protein GCM10009827_014190 [Dactylosporangium maewongense]|uniref:Uncharacterized protein n=1 Tax=Dactylosporangium maewongense TaxID=634393 RepID=A0ABN1ZRH3_9ACTN
MAQPDEDLLTVDDRLDPDVRDPEASPADAAEQALPADPTERGTVFKSAHPWDANEYDAVEQDRDAGQDDEYR